MSSANEGHEEKSVAEIELFDALSHTYTPDRSSNKLSLWNHVKKYTRDSVVPLTVSALLLAVYFIALIFELKLMSLVVLLLLIVLLMFMQLIFLWGQIKTIFINGKRNTLVSVFRKKLVDDLERKVVIEKYKESTCKKLATQLKTKIEQEDSRLNMMIGATRKLGAIPAVAAIYAAYISVFPENPMVVLESDSEILEKIVTLIQIFLMAAIVGIYLGACAAEIAMLRIKSMIHCLDECSVLNKGEE